jgi:hypothetical protein
MTHLWRQIVFTLVFSPIFQRLAFGERPESPFLAVSLTQQSVEQAWAVNGLDIGSRPEGSVEDIDIIVRNKSNQRLSVDLFAVGSKLRATWLLGPNQHFAGGLLNRINLPPSGRGTIRLTFTAHDPSVQDLQLVNLMQNDGVLSRIVVKYQIRPGTVTFNPKTPPLVSGLKKGWNHGYYELCSGPAPYGYTIDQSSVLFKAEAGGSHPRACGYHVDCQPQRPFTDANVCYKFSIEGDEDGDVLHVPASLAVTYVLKTKAPSLE